MKTKPKLPRAPLPRQTEKVHSPRQKPLPPLADALRDYTIDDRSADDALDWED